ncbi:MAG: LLM class F420-dependent oxidoreductase, partial [Gammaproteobacteria bacterium]|nr:LLM class F420-dependent oxidoreductase [Gammaproteobacteria bacterium]NIT17882.1 LLM class F420-dependent oxidoreductase [Gammaproteobacteria bacterium]
MRISMLLSYAGGFKEAVKEVAELEKAGLDLVWVPEAYSFDAPSAMGYLAANTERVTIASGILPIYSRTPSLLAMTAAGIDYLSDGRCMLGLGASGPQVIEGFHGVPYEAPVSRIREIIEICRKVWRRERLQHDGRYYQIPLPQNRGTGLGKALKLINHPVREEIPIAIAALGAKSVESTAELADAWLPAFYTAEAADAVWGDALRAGATKRDPGRAPLEVFAGGAVAIGEGLEDLRNLARPQAALYIGGMGARQKNFYNDIFSRSGYAEEAKLIQDLYLSGDKKAAEAAIPDSYLANNSLIGPEG